MNSDCDLSSLKPGNDHYMAYVGPPTEFDLMGATQFRLLCTLGLRSHHKLLDFGCGSLRAGKLFLSYLDKACYFGIDPNLWLVEEAINHQVGQELITLKSPRFDNNIEFKSDVFGETFDYILAQSIFSHTGKDLICKALHQFKGSLNPGGLIAVTFVESDEDFEGKGWVYPECVSFSSATLEKLADDAGLYVQRIPWHHPRQTWYLLALDKQRLPPESHLLYLHGYTSCDLEHEHPWSNPLLKQQVFVETPEAFIEDKVQPRLRWFKFLKALFPNRHNV